MNRVKDSLEIRRAAVLSLIISVVLLVIKFIAFFMTSSQAILSDALESIVNVLAGSFAIAVVRISLLPADQNHPYGHGKAEYFSAFFEGSLILFAGVMILIDAGASLFRTSALQRLDAGLLLTIGAGIVNAIAGIYLKYIGRTRKSTAMNASGEHLLSDSYTSLGVITGLLLVKLTGINVIDSIVALVVGCILVITGIILLKRAVIDLMDTADDERISELASLFTKKRFMGLIHIHHLRILRAGNQHHIDAHFVLPEFWSVKKSLAVMNKFEKNVMEDYSHDGEIHFHVDACERKFCVHCNVKPCPIRKAKFSTLIPLDYNELISDRE